jgi:probable rRNA maturation factor
VLAIEVNVAESCAPVDGRPLREAVQAIVRDAGFERGSISLAIVGDATIHALNRRHLGHDYSTDVLSFVLESGEGWLEGEVIASMETAARRAPEFGWTAADELLLYVIHGALHLVGHDDREPDARRAMRAEERKYLSRSGIELREDAEDANSDDKQRERAQDR